MTINYQCDTTRGRCYVQDHMPDWDLLRECFPRRIRPSDIDGMVEINGYVLFLEWKGKGVALSNGQATSFFRMTKHALRQQVWVIYGERGLPFEFQIIQGGRSSQRQRCSLEKLREMATMWGSYADNAEPP